MASQNLRARYTLVNPTELMGVIRRSKTVTLKDSPNDRIVGFECDGKLWGFEIGDPENQKYFSRGLSLVRSEDTCPTCGHVHVEFKMVPSGHPGPVPEVALLKSHGGRKKLEKPCGDPHTSLGENR